VFKLDEAAFKFDNSILDALSNKGFLLWIATADLCIAATEIANASADCIGIVTDNSKCYRRLQTLLRIVSMQLIENSIADCIGTMELYTILLLQMCYCYYRLHVPLS